MTGIPASSRVFLVLGISMIFVLFTVPTARGQNGEITFENIEVQIESTRVGIEEAKAAGNDERAKVLEEEMRVFQRARDVLLREKELEELGRQRDLVKRRAERQQRELNLRARLGHQVPEILVQDEIDRLKSGADGARRTAEQADGAVKSAEAEIPGLAGQEASINDRLPLVKIEHDSIAEKLKTTTEEDRPRLERRLSVLRFELIILDRHLRHLESRRLYLKEYIPILQLIEDNAKLDAEYLGRKLERFQERFAELTSQEVRKARKNVSDREADLLRAQDEKQHGFQILLMERMLLLAREDLELQETIFQRSKLALWRKGMTSRIEGLHARFGETRKRFDEMDRLDEGDIYVLRQILEDVSSLEKDFTVAIAPEHERFRTKIEGESRALFDNEKRSGELEAQFRTELDRVTQLHVEFEQVFPDTPLSVDQWRSLRRSRIDTVKRTIQERIQLIHDLNQVEDEIRTYRSLIEEYRVFFENKRLWLREKSRIQWSSFVQAGTDLLDLPGGIAGYLRSIPGRTGDANRKFRENLTWYGCLALASLFLLLVAHYTFLRYRIERSLQRRLKKMKWNALDRFILVLLRQSQVGTALGSVLFLFFIFHALFGTRGETILALLTILGFTLFYVHCRRLLDTLFAPKDSSQRVLFWVDDDTAQHVHRCLNWLFRVAVATAPLAIVLNLCGYDNKGFLEGLWFLHKTLVLLTVLWLLSRRRAMQSLLPPGETIGHHTLELALSFVSPLLFIFAIFIYTLDVRGYREASAYFVKASGFSFIVLILAVMTYNLACEILVRRLRKRHQSRLKGLEEEAEKQRELERFEFHQRFGRLLFYWVLVAITFVAVCQAFGLTVVEARHLAQGPQWILGGSLSPWDLISGFLLIYFSLRIAEILKGVERYHLFHRTGVNPGTEYTIETATRYLTIGTGIILAMGAIHLNFSDFQWLMAAAGVGIGFGLQEVIANFICGIVLLAERSINVGDYVIVGETHGIISKITIRYTTLRSFDNNSLIIPNKVFVTSQVLNMTDTDIKVRRDVPVGVAYGSDLGLVRKVLLEAVERDGRILTSPPPEILFERFGESSLDFTVRFWPDPSKNVPWPRLRTDVLLGIDALFRRNGITIPFPQRDLHLETIGESAASAIAREVPDASGTEGPRPLSEQDDP